ncbi:MAG: SDR family NAD(P)-dependent oxidoreductase [Rhodobacteraceae bacterium]|nr:SDR family NAD(P)-dependent oxidoreductase [Paracoccaceae bacterium]
MITVITGAANGLGRALALASHERGEDVLAIDLDAQSLETLPTKWIALDLTSADAAARIASESPISRIIHSAGISGTGPFESIPAEHHARILALNLEAPVAITCALLRAQAMAPGATHAFVGSLSTYTGYPGAVSYAASKDGLASFAASLRKSLPDGDHAACIFPGPMATNHAARYAPDNSEKTVAARQSTEEAAALILKGLDARKAVIVPGGKARLMATVCKLAPGLAGRLLKKALYEKLTEPRL